MTEFVKNHGAERQTLPIRVEIQSVAGVMIDGEALEVDMAGLRMVSSRDLPVGTECTVVLIVEERPDPIRVPIRGEVSEADDTGMRIDFRESDEDRLKHLRDIAAYAQSGSHRS